MENVAEAKALVQRLDTDNKKHAERIAAQDGEIAALKRTVAELAQERALSGAARSDERVMRYIGKEGKVRLHGFSLTEDGDVIERGDDDRYAPGLLDASEKGDDWQQEVQREHETLSILRSRLGDERATRTKGAGRLLSLLRAGPAPVAKFFGQVTGSGLEWMPSITLPVLERELREMEGISQLFQRVPVSSRTFEVPYLNSGGVTPYIYGAQTAEDPAKRRSSSMTTAKRTHTPRGMAIRLQWDMESAEDSIIDAVPEMRRAMSEALMNGEADAVINGDTTATHQDTIASWDGDGLWASGALGGADDHRRIWIGLRKRALAIGADAKKDMSAVMTADGFLDLKGLLASAHSRVGGGMVYLVSPRAHDLMLKFTELLTLDKVGPRATILSGQVAALWGHPVVSTPMLSREMNASGVYDGSTKTKTGVLAVDVSRFKFYDRRGTSVYLVRDDTRGTSDLVVAKRTIFGCVDPDSKINVSYGYNITA